VNSITNSANFGKGSGKKSRKIYLKLDNGMLNAVNRVFHCIFGTLMTIHVKEDDIQQAGPGIIGNPIARALSRQFGTRWRVWDGRIAQEMVAPYRVVQLPETVRTAWDTYADFSELPPFSFEIEWQEELKYAA
jgi:hypothetical protein